MARKPAHWCLWTLLLALLPGCQCSWCSLCNRQSAGGGPSYAARHSATPATVQGWNTRTAPATAGVPVSTPVATNPATHPQPAAPNGNPAASSAVPTIQMTSSQAHGGTNETRPVVPASHVSSSSPSGSPSGPATLAAPTPPDATESTSRLLDDRPAIEPPMPKLERPSPLLERPVLKDEPVFRRAPLRPLEQSEPVEPSRPASRTPAPPPASLEPEPPPPTTKVLTSPPEATDPNAEPTPPALSPRLPPAHNEGRQ